MTNGNWFLLSWKKKAWYQQKTYYPYEQGNIVCELDASGNFIKNNYFAPDGLIARHIGTSLGIYSFDHQGNVLRVNDAGLTDIRFDASIQPSRGCVEAKLPDTDTSSLMQPVYHGRDSAPRKRLDLPCRSTFLTSSTVGKRIAEHFALLKAEFSSMSDAGAESAIQRWHAQRAARDVRLNAIPEDWVEASKIASGDTARLRIVCQDAYSKCTAKTR